MYRQGDVLLIPVENPISTRFLKYVRRKKGQGIILATGEATGHHHRVRETSAREYRGPGQTRYLKVGAKGATMTHEEHDPVAIPEGVFQVVQQREYEPVIRDNSVMQRTTRQVYD